MVSVPVEVWWGLEWVRTEGCQVDEKTISARLQTRTGEVKICRIRNAKRAQMWRHANDKVSYHADNAGGAHGKDTNDK